MASDNENDKWDKWNIRLRDSALFLAGLAGIINEVFFVAVPRPSILLFLSGLVGLPFVLDAENLKRRRDTNE